MIVETDVGRLDAEAGGDFGGRRRAPAGAAGRRGSVK